MSHSYRAQGEDYSPRSEASAPVRSKMISLGMNNLQPQNPRLRPQPRASDFPFDDAANVGYVPGANPDQRDYSPRRNEYYKKFLENDRLSLAQQKADVEKYMREKEEVMQMPAREKVLSGGSGLSYTEQMEYTAPPRDQEPYSFGSYTPTEPDSSRGEKQTKAMEYMIKLDTDANAAIKPTRAAFVRVGLKDFDPKHPDNYLAIGSQMDKTSLLKQKRDGQAVYQQQLAKDLLTKEAKDQQRYDAPERRPVVKVRSPPSDAPDPFDKLGVPPDRRAQARLILEANRDGIMQRMNCSSPEERQKVRHGQFNRADEIARFEDAPYRAIGHANDEAASRDKRKAMQEKYLKELLKDCPPSPGM
jgi:hypothetical protein